jgi:epsin
VAAKELTALVLDEDRLRSERSDRKLWKTRVSGLDEGYGNSGAEPSRREPRRRNGDDDSDTEYRLAIEASKAEAEDERRRRAKETMGVDNDEDLAKAIKLSREEEDLRKRELEESNAQSLFDETPAAQVQPTGYNQGYQQQGAVDWFGNPINAQQPMTTGFLNNQYAQPTGFQNQPTGMNNPYAAGFQNQPTGYEQNPYSQPQNNFLQPQATIQPQNTSFNPNNPYGGGDIFSQQQQQPQENYQSAGSNNPWSGNQPQQQHLQPADALKPMPTGSNNPFAQRTQTQFNHTAQTGPPTLNSLAEDRTTNQFAQNNVSQYGQNKPFAQPAQHNPIAGFQAPQPPKSTPPQHQDPHHARLNALLGSGEGQDTFGNVGDLRIPAQHTAPGTFVNSAGQGLDRLHAAPTGNPYFQQQFTGMPQQTGYVQQQQPANSNPWGGQQQQRGGGSLIDL